MKCLILAAGYATRLYPLTENFPKPLLPVKEKPILDWLIEDIDASGEVEEYIVISNHKYVDHFIDWALKHSQRIIVADDGTESNEMRLGAVRDIQFVIDEMKLSEDLLVIAGDNLLDFSLTDFISYAKTKGTSCIMRYYEPSDVKLRKCGVVEIDGGDRILSMEEKPENPKTHWCCPPFYFYKAVDVPLVAKGIESGCGVDAPGSFIAWLSTQTAIHAMEMPGKRYDIGDLDSYRAVQKIFKAE